MKPRTLSLFAAAAVLAGLGLFGHPGSPGGPEAAVITNTVENMFSGPSSDVDVVSQALLGMTVRVLESETNGAGEEWRRVETPDTYRGWVIASSLRFLKAEEKPYASAGKIAVVTALLANTYRESDVTGHKPIKVAPIGSVLEVSAEKDDRWAEVVLPCGTRAWIQKGDVELREAPMTWDRRSPEEMVALSRRFIGLPYLWGGNSPLGIDCSGFAQLIYKMGGVPILRDADVQFEGSGLSEVPTGEERAGDLVFFGRSPDRIGHVGMMINGEEFINATVHEKPVVQISVLKDPYWRHIYQGARRPKS